MDPEILTAALCLSRGNGKSPGYPGISHPGSWIPRVPTSGLELNRFSWRHRLEQGRIVFRFAREILDDDPAYKFSDSYVRSAIVTSYRDSDLDTADLQQREGSDGFSPLSLCVG